MLLKPHARALSSLRLPLSLIALFLCLICTETVARPATPANVIQSPLASPDTDPPGITAPAAFQNSRPALWSPDVQHTGATLHSACNLGITSVTVTPSPAARDESVTITARVENMGLLSCAAGQVLEYYFSTNSVISTFDFLVGTGTTTKSLNLGSAQDVSISFTPKDQGVIPDTYWVGVRIVSENEFLAAENTLTIGPSTTCDIDVLSLSASPNPAFDHEDITITASVINYGATCANTEFNFYLWEIFELLGTKSLTTPLNYGNQTNLDFTFNANDKEVFIGSYTLYLTIPDINSSYFGDILEIQPSTVCNIDFLFLSPSPLSVFEDQEVTITAGIVNNGTGICTNKKIYFYISSNSTLSFGDTFLGEYIQDEPLNSGEQSLQTITFVPQELNLEPRTYWVGALVVPETEFFASAITLTINEGLSTPVNVSLPALTCEADQDLRIPVMINDDVSSSGINSYAFSLSYASDIIDITSALTSGTLSEGWTITSTITSGQIDISATGPADLEGSGDLIILAGRCLTEGTSPLTWNSFSFNEGSPPATLTDGTITVSGAPVNANPTPIMDEATTDEDTPVTINILANDTDPDGDPLTVDSVGDPEHGTVVLNGDGTITYTPEMNYYGTDTFDYTVNDDQGGSATAAVTVTINSVNDAPTPPMVTEPANGTSLLIEGDPNATLTVSWTTAIDPEGDTVSYVWELATSETFDTVLHRENVGTATQFELDYAFIAGLLTAQGIGPNEDLTVYQRAVASDGSLDTAGPSSSIVLTRGTIVGTEENASIPDRYVLAGNYPNLFRATTTFRFALPDPGPVRIEVYNILGEQVGTLIDGVYSAGWHTARWDATELVSGIYFVRMQAKDVAVSQTVTKLK